MMLELTVLLLLLLWVLALPVLGVLLSNDVAEGIVANETGIVAPFHITASQAVTILRAWGINTSLWAINASEPRAVYWDYQMPSVIDNGTTTETMLGKTVKICAISKERGATIVPVPAAKSALGKMAYAAIAMTKDDVRPGWYNPDTHKFTAGSLPKKPTLK
jgi:hypothetical protein